MHPLPNPGGMPMPMPSPMQPAAPLGAAGPVPGDMPIAAPPVSALPAAVRPRPHHHAQAVMLDTHTHLDSRGHEHHTHAGNPAIVGPHTLILMAGHEPMTAADHMRTHGKLPERIEKNRANPHPNAVGKRIVQLHRRMQHLPNPGMRGT